MWCCRGPELPKRSSSVRSKTEPPHVLAGEPNQRSRGHKPGSIPWNLYIRSKTHTVCDAVPVRDDRPRLDLPLPGRFLYRCRWSSRRAPAHHPRRHALLFPRWKKTRPLTISNGEEKKKKTPHTQQAIPLICAVRARALSRGWASLHGARTRDISQGNTWGLLLCVPFTSLRFPTATTHKPVDNTRNGKGEVGRSVRRDTTKKFASKIYFLSQAVRLNHTYSLVVEAAPAFPTEHRPRFPDPDQRGGERKKKDTLILPAPFSLSTGNKTGVAHQQRFIMRCNEPPPFFLHRILLLLIIIIIINISIAVFLYHCYCPHQAGVGRYVSIYLPYSLTTTTTTIAN